MKKRMLSQICMLIFLVCTFLIKTEEASAFEYKISFGETISIQSDEGFELVDIRGLKSKIKVKVEVTNVSVYDDAGNVIDGTITVCCSFDEDLTNKIWSVQTGKTLSFMTYLDWEDDEDVLQFSTDRFTHFSLDLKITKVSDAKLTISCHQPITMKDTGSKKVRPKVYYGDEDVSEFADFKVKASKKNLIDIDTSCSDIEDYFYLEGNYKSGKCKITVTAKYKGQSCSDSFKLHIYSTLKNNLYFLGSLNNYNTRSNIFRMSLTNRSKKQITIYSKGAVALDNDYVTFDRNLKMTKNKKSITIKPGKSKTISWKVLGNTTWYQVEDFQIHFKCKYKGKVCWVSVQGDSVYVWKKGKWKKMNEI